MGQSRTTLFWQSLDEFQNFIQSDLDLDNGHTFRWRGPSPKHDFFPDWDFPCSWIKGSDQNIYSNNKEEVENEDLLCEEGVQCSCSVECKLEQMHFMY